MHTRVCLLNTYMVTVTDITNTAAKNLIPRKADHPIDCNCATCEYALRSSSNHQLEFQQKQKYIFSETFLYWKTHGDAVYYSGHALNLQW